MYGTRKRLKGAIRQNVNIHHDHADDDGNDDGIIVTPRMYKNIIFILCGNTG